jgi:hypothetical protein
MKDPERFLQGDAGDLGRKLLEAARDEQPSPELLARMARGLGLPLAGAPGAISPETSSPLAAPAAASGSSLATTIGVSAGIVVAAVVAGVVGFKLMSPPPAPQESPPAAQISPPAPAAAAVEPGQRSVAPPSPPASPDQIREEIRLLDAARASLQARAPRSALDHLDRYGRRFPRGAFGPEAAALRIEALVRDGQGRQAAGLAARFRAEHPDSPLVKRIDQLTASGR